MNDSAFTPSRIIDALEVLLAQLEASLAPEMNEGDTRSDFLKKRISGPQGHLSNQEAGNVLARIPHAGKMQVFLAHLSQHNNHPQLALRTVSEILQQQGCSVGEDVLLKRTYPAATASWVS